MDFVEDYRADAGQRRSGEEPAFEHALRDVEDAGCGGRDVLEAHGVAHRLADGLAAFLGDVARGEARGEPPWFRDQDLARDTRIEERAGDARRLARAGFRRQNERRRTLERADDLGQDWVDGERAQGGEPSADFWVRRPARHALSRKAALFDMDRTLVRVDSATLYVRYQRAKGQATFRDTVQVAWWMAKYTLGVIDAERVAKQALRSFRGKEEAWLEKACEELFLDYMLPHVATAGRGAVERHRTAGDFIAIVTGATPYAAQPLARELGIEHVVATRLEVEDGRFTGNVAPPMAYGKGKIVLTEQLAREQGFSLEEATFYSDSITDLPLLERVLTPVVVNPDRRLRRVARARGWRIEAW